MLQPDTWLWCSSICTKCQMRCPFKIIIISKDVCWVCEMTLVGSAFDMPLMRVSQKWQSFLSAEQPAYSLTCEKESQLLGPTKGRGYKNWCQDGEHRVCLESGVVKLWAGDLGFLRSHTQSLPSEAPASRCCSLMCTKPRIADVRPWSLAAGTLGFSFRFHLQPAALLLLWSLRVTMGVTWPRCLTLWKGVGG